MSPLMLAYTPFLDPLPIVPYWWVVMLVLVVLISLAYKTIKLPNLAHLPRQTAIMTIQIMGFMIVAGVLIGVLVALV